MAARIKEHATYEDLLKVPDHLVAELINGELYTSPRPRARHGHGHSIILGAVIGRYGLGGSPGGWWIITEPEVHFGRHALVPDVAGWRRERMPDLPESHIFDVVPDWVCEVLSPSTIRLDLGEKLDLYGQYGVPWAWYVNIDVRTLQVMALDNGAWKLVHTYVGGDVVRAEPFPEAEIDLKLIWGGDPE